MGRLAKIIFFKEILNKSILDFSECAESGPGPYSATPNQALACLIRGAPSLAQGMSELVQRFLKRCSIAALLVSVFTGPAFAQPDSEIKQCPAEISLPDAASTTTMDAATDHIGADDATVTQLSIPGYEPPAAKSSAEEAAAMVNLHAWLSQRAAPLYKNAGYEVTLGRQELFNIGELKQCPECDQLKAEPRRVLVGIGQPIDSEVDFSALRNRVKGGAFNRGAVVPAADGGFVWTTVVTSKGAQALRLVFKDLNLPANASLYVYNRAGEAFGPYGGKGTLGSGMLVSNTLTGDAAFVQLHVTGSAIANALKPLRFRLAEVAHIGPRFEVARWINPALNASTKSFCDYNATCVTNGECTTRSSWAAIDSVRRAVAHIIFPVGSDYYICSGGLVNSTANNGRNLFLTAHHCLDSAASANGLEAFFNYRAASCQQTSACDLGYPQMRAQFPRVLGAAVLATGSSGDYSLLELNGTPAGQPYYLGFSAAPVANARNFMLYRLSYPNGGPQAFSRHVVDTTARTCSGHPRERFIYSRDMAGATEGGSSGSLVLNSAGQVVGQLYGSCGPNPDDSCDSGGNRTMDGALASYYSKVARFLNPN